MEQERNGYLGEIAKRDADTWYIRDLKDTTTAVLMNNVDKENTYKTKQRNAAQILKNQEKTAEAATEAKKNS